MSSKLFFAFALVALVTMLPDLAHAAASDGSEAIGNGVCKIVALVTSKVGKGIATLAIVFLGIGAFFGKVNWGLALMVTMGIVAIFGSSVLANYIAAGANSTATDIGCVN